MKSPHHTRAASLIEGQSVYYRDERGDIYSALFIAHSDDTVIIRTTWKLAPLTRVAIEPGFGLAQVRPDQIAEYPHRL